VQEGYFDEKRATVRMAELIAEYDQEELAIEAGERERRERGVTFREVTVEWLEYLQHERGAKPSTLSDYRYIRARSAAPPRQGQEPRSAHGRVRRPARGEDHHKGDLHVPAQA